MESDKAPVRQGWRFSLLLGFLMGILPVIVLLAVYLFAEAPDALNWPDFTPIPLVFICGWIAAGICCATSVSIYIRSYSQIPRKLLTLWLLRALMIAAWLGVLLIRAELSFLLAAALLVVSVFTATAAYRKPLAINLPLVSLIAACPVVLWTFYILSVLYVMLLRTA